MNSERKMFADPCLEVRDLSVQFGGIRALDGATLSVRKGEILGIIGPNGAGKTTLFNAITGMVQPTAGTIRFMGQSLIGQKPEQICRLGVTRTYQKVRPFSRLTVLQNVMVPIVNRSQMVGGMLAARSLAFEILERVDLVAYANTEAASLNLYHRKKIELARAIGAGGTLLLLDEVMAGLTPVECDAAVVLLRSLKDESDLTIVCIEHLMRIVMAISDHITVLDRGRVIADGSPKQVADNELVQKAYFGTSDA
jgi:branched-chain amino acid transport system ATP-binding protein